MKILLMTGVTFLLAFGPAIASAETHADYAKCQEIGIFAKYVQIYKMSGSSKKTAYRIAMENTKKTSEYTYFQISKHKAKSLLKKVYNEHDLRTGNDAMTKYNNKCEKQFSHKEPPLPNYLSRCLQIKRVEDQIEGLEEIGRTPGETYTYVKNMSDPFGNWHISPSYAKRLVNLTYFNPQWQRLANATGDPIGRSLKNDCMQAHQNKIRGFQPLK